MKASPHQGAIPWSADIGDGDLAALALRGRRDAAAALIDRHQRPVRTFLYRLTGRADLADDLAQETFLRLLKALDRYDPRYPMRTWLLTIARRLWINHAARCGNHPTAIADDGLPAPADDPREAVARSDDRQALRRSLDAALAKLPPAQRTALALYHVQELPVTEVARVMDLPVGTVKSHLHRGRAALRETLEPTVREYAP